MLLSCAAKAHQPYDTRPVGDCCCMGGDDGGLCREGRRCSIEGHKGTWSPDGEVERNIFFTRCVSRCSDSSERSIQRVPCRDGSLLQATWAVPAVKRNVLLGRATLYAHSLARWPRGSELDALPPHLSSANTYGQYNTKPQPVQQR
jgi:hypothetical protein